VVNYFSFKRLILINETIVLLYVWCHFAILHLLSSWPNILHLLSSWPNINTSHTAVDCGRFSVFRAVHCVQKFGNVGFRMWLSILILLRITRKLSSVVLLNAGYSSVLCTCRGILIGLRRHERKELRFTWKSNTSRWRKYIIKVACPGSVCQKKLLLFSVHIFFCNLWIEIHINKILKLKLTFLE